MRIQIQGLDLGLGVVLKISMLFLHERGLGAFPMTLERRVAMASRFQFGVLPLAKADRLISSLKTGAFWKEQSTGGLNSQDVSAPYTSDSPPLR